MNTRELERRGVRLLWGERIEYLLESGMKHGELALTNKRVIWSARTGRNSQVTVASIRDIDLVEMKHRTRNGWLLAFGILLLPILIGIILLFCYFRSGNAEIIFKSGGTKFSGRFKASKADEVHTVVQRFFELREK